MVWGKEKKLSATCGLAWSRGSQQCGRTAPSMIENPEVVDPESCEEPREHELQEFTGLLGEPLGCPQKVRGGLKAMLFKAQQDNVMLWTSELNTKFPKAMMTICYWSRRPQWFNLLPLWNWSKISIHRLRVSCCLQYWYSTFYKHIT